MLLISPAALAFEFIELLFSNPQQNNRRAVRASALVQPQTRFENSPRSRRYTLYQPTVFLGLPLYSGEQASLSAMTRNSVMDLAPSGSPIPPLYDLSLGLNYVRELAPGENASVWLNVASPSNEPFADLSVTNFMATTAYTYPVGAHSSWLFLVNYSSQRTTWGGIPLPGFAYRYKVDRKIQWLLGFPTVAMKWDISEKWNLAASAFYPPGLGKATLTYRIAGPLAAYGGWEWAQNTFLLYKRTDSKERLYYDERKAFVGFRAPLGKLVLADLEGGYSYERRFIQDRKFRHKPKNRKDLSNSWAARLSLMANF
jgi:hypothetical protein